MELIVNDCPRCPLIKIKTYNVYCNHPVSDGDLCVTDAYRHDYKHSECPLLKHPLVIKTEEND